jgi:hypothetical protein
MQGERLLERNQRKNDAKSERSRTALLPLLSVLAAVCSCYIVGLRNLYCINNRYLYLPMSILPPCTCCPRARWPIPASICRYRYDRVTADVNRTMAGISSLPEEIAISITASNRIADLSQLVEELACNSLDAKATQIDIFVNLELMRIEVSDNGDGFDAQVVQVRNSSSTPSKCSSQLNL